MNLEDFIAEEVLRIEEFMVYWKDMNKLYPEEFPLCIEGDNAGLWYECLQCYESGSIAQ